MDATASAVDRGYDCVTVTTLTDLYNDYSLLKYRQLLKPKSGQRLRRMTKLDLTNLKKRNARHLRGKKTTPYAASSGSMLEISNRRASDGPCEDQQDS